MEEEEEEEEEDTESSLSALHATAPGKLHCLSHFLSGDSFNRHGIIAVCITRHGEARNAYRRKNKTLLYRDESSPRDWS